MAYTVEYIAHGTGLGEGAGETAGATSALTARRAIESFATQAEAIAFVSRLPPLHDPVLVMEDGERLRGPALGLHVVNWQDTHQGDTSPRQKKDCRPRA